MRLEETATEGMHKKAYDEHNYTYHSFDDLPKDNVTSIKPGGFHSGDEELRTIRVFASVGHAQPTRALVVELKVLVLELVTIDTLACRM